LQEKLNTEYGVEIVLEATVKDCDEVDTEPEPVGTWRTKVGFTREKAMYLFKVLLYAGNEFDVGVKVTVFPDTSATVKNTLSFVAAKMQYIPGVTPCEVDNVTVAIPPDTAQADA